MRSKSGKMLKHFMVAAVSYKTILKIAGLVGLSLGSMAVDEALRLIKLYLWRNFVTELEVTNSDRSYNWLLQWISKQNQQLLHFSVTTKPQNIRSSQKSDQVTQKFYYQPNTGVHMIK